MRVSCNEHERYRVIKFKCLLRQYKYNSRGVIIGKVFTVSTSQRKSLEGKVFPTETFQYVAKHAMHMNVTSQNLITLTLTQKI